MNLSGKMNRMFHDSDQGPPGVANSIASNSGVAPVSNNIAPDWTPLTRGQIAILIALLILALALRFFRLATYPHPPNHTLDEYSYAWVGLSLLDEGKPTTWSYLKCYPEMGIPVHSVAFNGFTYSMVTPALDHPPLFSLLAGVFAKAMGARRVAVPQQDGTDYPFWDVDLGKTRLLSIILFGVSFLLLFEICRHSSSFGAAAITLVFYGAISHIVVHSKLLVTENLTTPLFLLNIYFLQRYVAGKCSETAFAVVSILATAAALLSKLVAVSQAPAIVFLLLLCGRRRETVYPVLGILLGAGLYALYGWWQGWDVFVAVLRTHSGRFDGFGTLRAFAIAPCLIHLVCLNLTLLAAWFLLFADILRRRGSSLSTAALVYVLSFTYFASASRVYGWHALPLYPFLCMALGVAIRRIWTGCDMAPFLVFCAFFLLDGLEFLFVALPEACHPFLRHAYPFLTALLLLPPLFWPKSRKGVVRFGVIVLVALGLARELWEIWRFV